jgi:hypothetical protein
VRQNADGIAFNAAINDILKYADADAWTNSFVLGADVYAYSASVEDIESYLSR